MNEIRVTLEVVTPLFLGGADPRGVPELRAPSFRGALRFWLRALLGGILGGDPKRVFEQESRVFGNTACASPVVLRVRLLGGSELKVQDYNPLPHKRNQLVRFKGFDPLQTFELILSSRDGNALEQASKALRLLCLLGGVGRRSRRGFGSLQIIDGDLSGLQVKSAEQFCKGLQEQLQDILSHNGCPTVSFVPKFPILDPGWAQVKVCGKEFSNGWQKAIEFVMQKAHCYQNPVLGWAKGGRQASPVHVRVTRLRDDGYTKYVLVLTTMLSELNPNLQKADRSRLVNFLADFDGTVVFGFKEVPQQWLTGRGK